MSSKNRYNSDQLLDWVLVEASTACTSCKTVASEIHTDEYHFSETLFHKGWRSTGPRIYCPACASKKLKQ